MLNRSHPRIRQIALFCFNYSSILCLKYANETFKVSNIQAVLNLLKMPFVSMTVAFIYFHEPLRQLFYASNLVALKDYSPFARISISIDIFLLNHTSYLLCILQVTRRKAIKDFVNSILEKSLEEKYFLKFRKYCIKALIVTSSLFTIYCIVQFVGAVKFSFLSIIVSFVIFFPLLVIASFAIFVKFFENFVIAIMKQFRMDLKIVSNRMLLNHNQNVEDFLRLSRQHQEIYVLVERFNKHLGLQLTSIVCFFTLMIIFSVSLT